MPEIAIVVPESAPVAAQHAPLVARALALTIASAHDHEVAQEIVRACRLREREIEEYFEPARKSLDRAKKDVLALRDGLIKPVADARLILSSRSHAYEAAARAAAEEERRRLEIAARKAEEERRLQDAILAEQMGDEEQAEAILERPPEPPPLIHVEPALAKVEGVSSRTVWRAEVRDFAALVQAVAARPDLLNLLLPNGPALNAMARAQHESMAVPGVDAVAETVTAVRG